MHKLITRNHKEAHFRKDCRAFLAFSESFSDKQLGVCTICIQFVEIYAARDCLAALTHSFVYFPSNTVRPASKICF